jgi:colanic acid/amylovoran biosynthesis protein
MHGRKYLIINAFGRSNRGDSVLLEQCFSEIMLADPQALISVAAFEGADAAAVEFPDIKWTERIGNSAHRGAIGRLQSVVFLTCGLLQLVPGLGFLKKVLPRGQQNTLDEFRASDIIVSAPGGYIHDTNLAYVIALYHIAIGLLLRRITLLAPQSIGPISSSLGRMAAKRILARCNAVCVREGYSDNFVRNTLRIGPDRIVRAGDSAFWDVNVDVDDAETDKNLATVGVAPGEQFVGATVVDWSFPNMGAPNELREAYLSGMAEVIRKTYELHGLRTVIFNQVSSDLGAARRVAIQAGDAALVNEVNFEPPLLRAMIKRSRVFLGTRFHSCIFAMIAGRPTIAISYLPKTEFIMKDLGLSNNTVDINKFDSGDVFALLDNSLGHVSEHALDVELAVASYRDSRVRFSTIITAINSSSKADQIPGNNAYAGS